MKSFEKRMMESFSNPSDAFTDYRLFFNRA